MLEDAFEALDLANWLSNARLRFPKPLWEKSILSAWRFCGQGSPV
jgi:hypothetical protein